jgi:hypothetical protein
MDAYGSVVWPDGERVDGAEARSARGMDPLGAGVSPPKRAWVGVAAIGAVVLVSACGSKNDQKSYDPVALGAMSTDTPFYDDGKTQIFQVKRPVSLPIVQPTDAERAALAAAVAPYDRTPWITKHDVRVQVSWTLSNLDTGYHNVEILLDPWNEFARYVPAINVGEETVQPDLSGIDLLVRVEGLERKTGVFTFDDMDEVATDLATVENILMLNPPMMGPPMPGTGPNINGMINHAFDLHNRSSDPDPLIGSYVPPVVAGLVGFDIGLRQYDKGTVAIELLVEVDDAAGNRVISDAFLKTDGTMWIEPDANVSAPMGAVR